MRRLSVMAMALCAVSFGSAPSAAQSAQRFSVQVSTIYAALAGDAFTPKDGGFGVRNGIGGEAQGRFTYHSFSVGAGFQFTIHNTYGDTKEVVKNISLVGGFLEPRYTIYVGSQHFAPYVSARLAYSVMSLAVQDGFVPEGLSLDFNEPSGPTINGGGGVLIKLNSRMNFDVGLTYGYTKFGPVKYDLKDTETGQAFTSDEFAVGSGQNAVIRAGLSIGIK